MKKVFIIALLSFYVIACNQNNSFDKEKYLKLGKETAQATGKLLSTKVKKAITEQGPFEAISFCNLQAYPLTDSLSKIHNAVIKRVAIKYRNADNQANNQEEKIINKYINLLSENKALKPVLKKENEVIHFYAPIKLQHACLTCHGIPGTEIPDTLYNHIKDLYPKDLAINFKEGDIRGIWSIEFKEE